MTDIDRNRAAIYKQFGRPEVLEIVDDWPTPALTAKEVRIKVAAVSLNPKDTLLRKGMFKALAREPLPRATALDLAGEVIEVGENVSSVKLGELVYGMSNVFSGGLLSEYTSLPESEIATAPSSIPLVDTAALPLAALTALQALRDCANCKEHTKLLVIGGSGGVGHFAVQLGVIFGADVHAACSQDNIEFVRSLGASEVWDYKSDSFRKLPQDYDVIFDVSGKYEPKHFKDQLGRSGIFVSTVPKPTSLWGELLARVRVSKKHRLVIVRSNTADLELLGGWVQQQKLKPIISHRFTMGDIRAAHKHMETGHTQGKIIVTT